MGFLAVAGLIVGVPLVLLWLVSGILGFWSDAFTKPRY